MFEPRPRANRARNPDRYLEKRVDGGYRYVRPVPDRVAALDGRRIVRKSLKTHDIETARLRRDAMEAADDALWARLAAGAGKGDPSGSKARYDAAVLRAMTLGFRYAPAADLFAAEPLAALIDRVEAIERLAVSPKTAPGRAVLDAVLGAVPAPRPRVSQALDVYLGEIEAGQKRSKSPAQYRNWEKVKRRAAANFIAVVGDLEIDAISRDDALAFWRWWLARVERGEVAANSAARDLGNMRVLVEAFRRHRGEFDAPNPFRGLAFRDAGERSRPPFETAWIAEKFLLPGPLAGLNREARGILLALVETGARPSEIFNLTADDIRLSGPVPFIRIAPAAGREIKTKTSIRDIPLVGVSRAAMEAHSSGFPRYRDSGNTFSATAMKYLRENGLLPTPQHSVYSFRHSFEKRMTEGGLDYGLRCLLMGHATDRPKYGDGGSLAFRRDELLKIALPFERGAV